MTHLNVVVQTNSDEDEGTDGYHYLIIDRPHIKDSVFALG